MAMNTSKRLRTYSIVFACLAALGAGACGSVEPSPTAPTPVTEPTPAPAPPPAPAPDPTPNPTPTPPPPPPSGPGRLEISIDPNPVQAGDHAIEGCNSDRPHRWVWDQVLRNTGGTPLTVTERVNFFNGDRVSTVTGFSITIQPEQSHKQTTRWCSAVPGPHTFRTDWSGSDANGGRIAVEGPTVNMQPR